MVRVSYLQPPSEHSLSPAYTHQLHPSPWDLSLHMALFWQQLASSLAVRHGAVAPGSCGSLLAPAALCTWLVAALAVCRAVCEHMHYRQPLQAGHTHSLYAKRHTCTCVCTHTHTHNQPGMHTHTSSVCVFVGCRQLRSPRTKGMKAQRACAPDACGWSPVTTLSCLLVFSGPTRTASWRIWTRLG